MEQKSKLKDSEIEHLAGGTEEASYIETPYIREDRCVCCGECARSCPVQCISIANGGFYVIDHSVCVYCGECISVCPSCAVVG